MSEDGLEVVGYENGKPVKKFLNDEVDNMRHDRELEIIRRERRRMQQEMGVNLRSGCEEL